LVSTLPVTSLESALMLSQTEAIWKLILLGLCVRGEEKGCYLMPSEVAMLTPHWGTDEHLTHPPSPLLQPEGPPHNVHLTLTLSTWIPLVAPYCFLEKVQSTFGTEVCCGKASS
jgi:hypothetical protein